VVAENVFVSTTSAPARKYSSWMERIMSGWVRTRRSLLPLTSLGQSLNRSPRYSASPGE
jgi:hypothetical protein